MQTILSRVGLFFAGNQVELGPSSEAIIAADGSVHSPISGQHEVGIALDHSDVMVTD